MPHAVGRGWVQDHAHGPAFLKILGPATFLDGGGLKGRDGRLDPTPETELSHPIAEHRGAIHEPVGLAKGIMAEGPTTGGASQGSFVGHSSGPLLADQFGGHDVLEHHRGMPAQGFIATHEAGQPGLPVARDLFPDGLQDEFPGRPLGIGQLGQPIGHLIQAWFASATKGSFPVPHLLGLLLILHGLVPGIQYRIEGLGLLLLPVIGVVQLNRQQAP